MTTIHHDLPYALADHTFAIATEGGLVLCYSCTKDHSDVEVVVFGLTTGKSYEYVASATHAREAYAKAKANGTLLSTEAAQQVIDGEAKLVRLTQRGRSFYRAVTGSPFRYAQACAKRSSVKTGYDVLSA